MKKKFIFLFITMSLSLVFSEDAKEMLKNAASALDAESVEAEAALHISGKNGKKTERTLSLVMQKGEKTRVLVSFLSPEDLAGLSFSSVVGEKESQIYVSAKNSFYKVRGSTGMARLFGPDIDLNELSSIDAKDVEYDMDGEEEMEGTMCRKVSCLTKDGRLSRVYISDGDGRIVLIESFSKSGKLEKKIKFSDVKNMDGRRISSKIRVENESTGGFSEMEILSIKFNQKIDSSIFDLERLVKR